MKQNELNRRDFSKMAAVAFGGVVAGTVVGCKSSKKSSSGKSDDDKTGGKTPDGKVSKRGKGFADVPNPWTGDKHVCRGLNACKDQGLGAKNECAGQGTCATAVHQACGKKNECKYQGGCGAAIAENSCKLTGKCAVPLKSKHWQKVRNSFEAARKAAGKTFGDAPAAKKPTE